MEQPGVYLDFAATAPLRPEALSAIQDALAIGANPSSVHAAGRRARAAIERARGAVADLAGAPAEQVVFTSGATEANALAINSAVASGRVRRLIVGAIEHDSVIGSAEASGLVVERLPVTSDGVYDLDWLRARLAAGVEGRPFVAMMAANNETGVLQPVAEAAAEVARFGGWLHVDAVQMAGRVRLNFTDLGVQTLSLSAHKLGGPQGVGALVHAPTTPIRPLFRGGGQESGMRGGTENVSGIAGFGAAAAAAVVAGYANLETSRAARDVEMRLRAGGVTIAGAAAARLSDFVCLAAASWRSELQVMALDLEGVRVSAGSACSSGKVKRSGVLEAMGFGDAAGGALRASGGWSTLPQHWKQFGDAWLEAHARHASRRRFKEFA